MPNEFSVKKWRAVIPMSKDVFLDYGIYGLAAALGADTEAKASWSWEQLNAERQRLQDLLHARLHAELLTHRFKEAFHG